MFHEKEHISKEQTAYLRRKKKSRCLAFAGAFAYSVFPSLGNCRRLRLD